MSEDGDIDVESSEEVPDIGVEATATTTNGILYRGGSHDKRAHHNALERRRRDHIKDSFHGLRDCIPSLVGEKVSRAHILNKATEYIRHMQKGGSTREDDICDIARKNEILEEQVQALDEARTCGGSYCPEDLLQNVASRVQARQAQEIVIQQLQAKAKPRPTRQQAKPQATPTTPTTMTTPALGEKPKTAAVTKNAETPISTSSPLHLPLSLLGMASNLKNTQSLLSVLQRNLSPNSSLPSNIKSLAARVLASPLIRGVQKTTQASSLPRGIVTATTVPKGSNVTTPTTATPTPSKPTPSAAAATTSTGTVNSDLQNTDPAQAELGRGKKGVAIDGKTTPLAAPSLDVGGGAPSLLTSQILEAHNLLQLQGATSGTAESAGTDLLEPHPPAAAEQGALNISPELLAQVSSLLNFPIPTAVNNASSAYPLLDCDGVVPTSQDFSSPHPSSHTTPTTGHAPNSSHKRTSSPSDLPPPPAKKPHVQN